MIDALLWPVVLPFLGAVASFVLPRRGAGVLGLSASGLTAAAVLQVVNEVAQGEPLSMALGGWSAPLGIELYVDGLSTVFLLLTAIVGVLVSCYAVAYFRQAKIQAHPRAGELFWPVWLMLWGSLNALFVSADVFNLYVILELVGLGAVGLVVLTGTRDVLGAGLRYLLVAMVGSLGYLMGVALLYGAHGTLHLYTIGQHVESGALSQVAFGLMTVGLLLKTAVFPLHFWLPPAHSSALAPVSAVLSALVVKGSFYILVRLWFEVFPEAITPAFGTVLGLCGAGAIVWGSWQALRTQRLKLLIAYSTVAQLGYLMFLFPVTLAAGPTIDATLSPWVLEGSKGTIFQVLAHGMAKASLFLVAGNLLLVVPNDRLSGLRGLAERMPFAVFTIGVAGVSLAGLPPSSGFVAKWLLLHAAIGVGQWWWVLFIIGGGLLTAGYLFRILHLMLLSPKDAPPLEPVPWGLQLIAMGLAALSLLTGVIANDLLYLIPIGTPFAPNLGGAG